MPIRILSGTSHPEFSKEVCRNLGVPLTKVLHMKFKNDNTFCRIEESIREDDIYIIQTSRPPVNDMLMELLLMVDAAKYASAQRITVVLPYYPYARSDKKDQPRVPVSARLVADMLVTAGVNRILTCDLHSPQIGAFFRVPADHLHASPVVLEYLKNRNLENHVVVATDAGGAKWTRFYAKNLQLPLAILDKRRDDNNDNAKVMSVIGEIQGKDCLILDDEISTGGSVVEAITALVEQGAKSVTACAIHPVFAGNAMEKLDASPLKELIVTNTIPLPEHNLKNIKLTQLSLAPLVADCIRRIHEGGSVSSLFLE